MTVNKYGPQVSIGPRVTSGNDFDLNDYFDVVLDASRNVTDTGGAVDSWADTRGVYTFTASGSERPTLTSSNSDFNNQPTIDFDGSANVLTGSGSTFAALFNGDDLAHEVYFVVRRNAGSGSDFLWTSADSGNAESIRVTTSATPNWVYNRSAVGQGLQSATSNAYSNATTNLFGVEFAGNLAIFYQQTTDITATSAVDANTLVDLTVSKIGANTGDTQNIDTDIAMIAWRIGGSLTAGQRAALVSYAQTRWSI